MVLDAGHGRCFGGVLGFGHLLGGASTVAGVLGTVAVVWVTLAAGFPRRQLIYWLRDSAPLAAAPEDMSSDLELRRSTRSPGLVY